MTAPKTSLAYLVRLGIVAVNPVLASTLAGSGHKALHQPPRP